MTTDPEDRELPDSSLEKPSQNGTFHFEIYLSCTLRICCTRSMNRLANSSGMSLIELMVAVAISTIGAMLIAQMLSNFSRLQKSVTEANAFSAFAVQMQKTLANPKKCGPMFQDQKIDPIPGNRVPVNLIMDGGPTPVSYPTQPYLFGDTALGLRVTEVFMEMSTQPPVDIVLEGTPGKRYLVTVGITVANRAAFAKDTSLGIPFARTKTLTLSVMTIANKIVDCGVEDSSAQLCVQLGGTYTPDATLPKDKWCQLAATFGGCMNGGNFVTKDSSKTCVTKNPATGDCYCPQGFKKYIALDFNSVSGDDIEYWQCMGCPP
jgi:prepilin-type N-terminal cleavage/methylation domain-containing protein